MSKFFFMSMTHPEWGPCALISDHPSCNAFSPLVGLVRYDPLTDRLVFGPEVEEPVFAALIAAVGARWKGADREVYVVELRPEVLTKPAFRKKNPPQEPGRERCVYVGATGVTPEQRLQNHFAGHKGAPLVRDYGVRLLPELYRHLNPMPYDVAEKMEEALAHLLREQGYAVHQA